MIELGEVGLAERARELAGAVGAKVEEDAARHRGPPSSPTSVGSMNSSVSSRIVGRAHGGLSGLGLVLGLPQHDRVPCALRAVPAAVAWSIVR